MTLRVVEIVEGTAVDGPGLRTAIYFAGCRHRCPGCHNPQTWPEDAGKDMTVDEIMEAIQTAGFNVTFTGGDPLYQMPGLLTLAELIRLSGKTIWCYTGFTYEEIITSPQLAPILNVVDVLVDGRFEAAQADLALRFRGSSNQRLIDCRLSTPDKIVLWDKN